VLEYAGEGESRQDRPASAWEPPGGKWRDNKDFDRVLDMVKGVNEMGMEVCCTLGMLNEEQAKKTS